MQQNVAFIQVSYIQTHTTSPQHHSNLPSCVECNATPEHQPSLPC